LTIYYVVYALLGAMSLFCSYFIAKEQTSKKMFCFFAFFVLFIMLALRHHSMGVDLGYSTNLGYLGRFDFISQISWSKIFDISVLNYERGYIIFNKIVSVFSDDKQFFLTACAAGSIAPIMYTIYKKSNSPFMSTIVYLGLPVFLLNYSGLRQALAIGLCTLSLTFVEEKKFYKFLLLVLLAMTFHKTAIVYLIVYPVYHIKLEKNLRWLSVVLIPIVYIFRYPLFAILSKIFKENAVATENDSGMLFVVFTLIYIFCIFYSNNSNEQNGLLNLFLLACLCQAFGNVYQTAMRVGYYFMIALILLLPIVIKDMDEKVDKPVFSIVIIISFVTFGLYCIYNSTWAMAYPYYFYWQGAVI